MSHDTTAQKPHFDTGVEQREVDSSLHVVDLPVVLRVQTVLPAHRQPSHPVHALEAHGAEIRPPIRPEVRQQGQSPRSRAQHRVDQMGAGPGRAQDAAEEETLVDLVPLLGHLRPVTFGGQPRLRGHQPGEDRCGDPNEFLDPEVTAAAIGQLVVDRVRVGVEEGGTHGARGLDRSQGSCPLLLRAPFGIGQGSQQLVGAPGGVGQDRPGGGQDTTRRPDGIHHARPGLVADHDATSTAALRSALSHAAR